MHSALLPSNCSSSCQPSISGRSGSNGSAYAWNRAQWQLICRPHLRQQLLNADRRLSRLSSNTILSNIVPAAASMPSPEGDSNPEPSISTPVPSAPIDPAALAAAATAALTAANDTDAAPPTAADVLQPAQPASSTSGPASTSTYSALAALTGVAGAATAVLAPSIAASCFTCPSTPVGLVTALVGCFGAALIRVASMFWHLKVRAIQRCRHVACGAQQLMQKAGQAVPCMLHVWSCSYALL